MTPPGWGRPLLLACRGLPGTCLSVIPELLSRGDLIVETKMHIILYVHLMPPSLLYSLLWHMQSSLHNGATCPLFLFRHIGLAAWPTL